MSDRPPLEYASPRPNNVPPERHRAIRYTVTLIAVAAFWFTLDQHRYVVLSSRVLTATNERDLVVNLVRDTRAENWDLGPYTVRSWHGLHYVRWPRWRADGRYVVVPQWLAMTVAGGGLLACGVWACRRIAHVRSVEQRDVSCRSW